ncbi:MAG: FMN phosphatase YigB (HAD superfamily) [Bacteroidia bacterium]|jgi:FMN phosphatase YigB (HAD superfamily)
MTTPKYAAWLFDLDGTLYSPLPVKVMMAVELVLFGAGKIKSIGAFRKEHEALRGSDAHFMPSPYNEQLSRAAAKLGCPQSELAQVVAKWMQDKPRKWIRMCARKSIIAELRSFRAAGGLTALVSDYPATGKLKALGIFDDFDVVVSNGEAGGPARLKPFPDGYQIAAKALGCEAESCLVIGDRQDADGLAAESAGMAFRLV